MLNYSPPLHCLNFNLFNDFKVFNLKSMFLKYSFVVVFVVVNKIKWLNWLRQVEKGFFINCFVKTLNKLSKALFKSMPSSFLVADNLVFFSNSMHYFFLFLDDFESKGLFFFFFSFFNQLVFLDISLNLDDSFSIITELSASYKSDELSFLNESFLIKSLRHSSFFYNLLSYKFYSFFFVFHLVWFNIFIFLNNRLSFVKVW